MPLHLITGRATAGKTEFVYEPLREAARAGGRPVLLLPTRPDVRRAQDEFAGKGVVGVEITTFDRWLEVLWMRFGDGRTLVDGVARDALVRQALAQTPDVAATASASTRGFVRLVARVLEHGGTSTPIGASAPGAGEQSVFAVVSTYERLLADADMIEPVAACKVLADSEVASGGPIGVNRFTEFTEAQETLLVALSSASEVYISLTWEQGFPATVALDGLVGRLVGVCGSHRTVPAPAPRPQSPSIIEPLLFGSDPGPLLAPGEWITIGRATGQEAEAALTARVVRDLVAEGFEPDTIAVAFPKPGRRLSALIAALRAEEIPVVADVVLRFGETAYGRAILALLVVASATEESVAHRHRLLAYLASPYCPLGDAEVAELDRMWRRTRVLDPVRLLKDAAGREGVAAAVEAARVVAGARVTADNAWRWQELADELLASARVSETGITASDMADAAAHRALLRAVSSAAAAGGASVSGTDLLGSLPGVSVVLSPADEHGAVQITEIGRLRSRRFDAVVLGGLTASEHSTSREAGPAERLLSHMGALGRPEPLDLQRLEFYQVVTRARRKLVLLHTTATSDGGEERASSCLEDVERLFALPDDEGRISIPEAMLLPAVSGADVEQAAPVFSRGRRAAREAAGAPQGPLFTVGRFADAGILAEFAERDDFSVTEVETYHSCPYAWFFGRVLSPRGIDRAVDARERGIRAHESLHAFYEQWIAAGNRRVTPDNAAEARALVAEIAAQAGRFSAAGIEEELSLAALGEQLQAIVDQDAEFWPESVPAYREWVFGEDGAAPALEIEGVRLHGRVDRIDVGPQGLMVTDYKGSGVAGVQSFAAHGLLQVPLYAQAASRALGLAITGGVYRSVKSREIRGFVRCDIAECIPRVKNNDVVEAGVIDDVVAAAADVALAAVAGIRAGHIEPAPRRAGACQWCSAAAFCPKATC